MPLFALGDKRPDIHPTAYLAPMCSIIGNVHVGAKCSVWDFACIRGDNEPIVLMDGCNVQENAVLHTDMGAQLTIGRNATIGHQVCLHGCTIEDGALVGIGAIVLNHARIGAGSVVGAGALVTEGKVFPAGSLILGSPAKVVRVLTDDELARYARIATGYQTKTQLYLNGLKTL